MEEPWEGEWKMKLRPGLVIGLYFGSIPHPVMGITKDYCRYN